MSCLGGGRGGRGVGERERERERELLSNLRMHSVDRARADRWMLPAAIEGTKANFPFLLWEFGSCSLDNGSMLLHEVISRLEQLNK